jgi:hypothetical protein
MSTTNVMPIHNVNATPGNQGPAVAGTPKGSAFQSIHLASNAVKGDQIAVHHNATKIVLQMRHQSPGEESILSPSFQVACELTPAEALAVASTLLALATPRINSALQQQAQSPHTEAS